MNQDGVRVTFRGPPAEVVLSLVRDGKEVANVRTSAERAIGLAGEIERMARAALDACGQSEGA